jgi:transcriptional regulator with XRE-family HTH domain
MKARKSDFQILGKVLREFREDMGISQEKLAAMTGLHRTYVGSVERGERNPSFQSINCLLGSLQKSWSELGQALDAELTKVSGRRTGEKAEM